MTKPHKPLDNVSLTAYRLIAILNMLKSGPHTELEINQKLKADSDFSRALSRDTIWLYINTLKALGCDISRPSRKNNYKYILKEHPFKLNLTNQEVRALLEVRRYISDVPDWELGCHFDKFLSTVSMFMLDEQKKALSNFRKNLLREIDYTLKKELLKEIEEYCKNNNLITIKYNSPSGQYSFITLIAETLKYENGALYLWGYNVDLEESQYLRIDRIDTIKEVEPCQKSRLKTPPIVVYKLFGLHTVSYNLETDEQIINQDALSITIEAKMKNKFKFTQKILSFGKDCKVLSPKELQEEILKKLKIMHNKYN